MKLLINDNLTFYYLYKSGPENFEENALEEFNDFIENEGAILDEFCIHHTFVNNYTSCYLLIYPQKVSLDEFNMNTLFSDVLRSFDTPYSLEYAWLGGKGCEFSLRLCI